jgi:hypothetical protein
MTDPHRARFSRGKGARHLSALVAKLTSPLLRSQGLADGGIIAHWADIAGPSIASLCVPERLVFPQAERSGGTLHLRVAGAFAPVLQHVEPQIVERVNAYFGYRAVARLRLVHGPVPERPQPGPSPAALAPEEDEGLQALLSPVAEDDLHGALARLGRAILGAPRNKVETPRKS